MLNKLSKIITGFAVFFCTAVFSATFFGSIDYIGRAEAANSDVNVTLAPVISMRVTKNNSDITTLALDVDPLPSGRFVKDDLSVLVSTSNITGYTLTMANNDDTTALTNTNNTVTDAIASITTLPTETTNTTTEANFPVNSWGYSLGDITDTNQTFSRIPTSSAADTIKATSTTSTEDATKVTFAAKADTAITAGTYQDTIVFSVVTNYVPPATATFTVAPVSTTNTAGGDTLTLDTDIDWIDNIGQMIVTIYSTPTNGASCTSPTATNNNGKLRITCTSPAMSVGTYNVDLELVRFNQKYTATNTIEYQAIPGLAGISNMQDMTSTICANSAVGDTKVMTDTRDNNTYTVRKMEDNKCWMTQNLRLGSTSAAITLTSADSDVSANFTIPTTAVQTSGTTSWSYDEVRVYNNGNSWIAPTSQGSNSTVNTSGTPPSQSQYIGNYYNWYTATAGTGTQNGVTSGNATSSICPKGWKLPTGGANSDITGLTGALVNITTNTGSVPTQSFTMQSSPNYFVLSGYYNSGVNNQGSYGRWWSRTAGSASNAYGLYLYTSYVAPQGSNYKYFGYSVRCLVQ